MAFQALAEIVSRRFQYAGHNSYAMFAAHYLPVLVVVSALGVCGGGAGSGVRLLAGIGQPKLGGIIPTPGENDPNGVDQPRP